MASAGNFFDFFCARGQQKDPRSSNRTKTPLLVMADCGGTLGTLHL